MLMFVIAVRDFGNNLVGCVAEAGCQEAFNSETSTGGIPASPPKYKGANMTFKPGDKVTVVIEGTINEIVQDTIGIKYFIQGKESYELSSARNPLAVRLIEGVENGIKS